MCTMKPLTIDEVISNIIKVRKYRNLSQANIASKIGIAQNGYSKIELGTTKLTIGRLFSIADALGVDAKYLLTLRYEALLLLIVGNDISKPSK